MWVPDSKVAGVVRELRIHYFSHSWSSYIQKWPVIGPGDQAPGREEGGWQWWSQSPGTGSTPISGWELGQMQVQDFLCPLQVLGCLLLHTLSAGRWWVTWEDRMAQRVPGFRTPGLAPYCPQSITMCLSLFLGSQIYAPHFTNKKTEATRDKVEAQGYTIGQWRAILILDFHFPFPSLHHPGSQAWPSSLQSCSPGTPWSRMCTPSR